MSYRTTSELSVEDIVHRAKNPLYYSDPFLQAGIIAQYSNDPSEREFQHLLTIYDAIKNMPDGSSLTVDRHFGHNWTITFRGNLD